jgi:hypothetical protein
MELWKHPRNLCVETERHWAGNTSQLVCVNTARNGAGSTGNLCVDTERDGAGNTRNLRVETERNGAGNTCNLCVWILKGMDGLMCWGLGKPPWKPQPVETRNQCRTERNGWLNVLGARGTALETPTSGDPQPVPD